MPRSNLIKPKAISSTLCDNSRKKIYKSAKENSIHKSVQNKRKKN